MDKILLVNDCKFEGVIMKDMLAKLGYKVKISTEYDALEEIKEFSPHIVIANFIMKEQTGDVLLRRVKQISEQIKCILSSSNYISRQDFDRKIVDEILHTPASEEKMKKLLNFIPSHKEDRINNFNFCPLCGKNLKELERNFKFCPYCGQLI